MAGGNVQYVNFAAVSRRSRDAIQSANRLLETEQWLDAMERRKSVEGGLPVSVEERVLEALDTSVVDMRAFAAAVMDVATEVEAVGALGDIHAEALDFFIDRGQSDAAALFSSAAPELADYGAELGLS